MNKTRKLTTLIGASVVASLAAAQVSADSTLFGYNDLSSGYNLALLEGDKEKGKEGKCGEGKCGEGKDKKGKEGKCGEGKCGEGKDKKEKGKEGKCGEGKCGGLS